jgi:predicted Zn-dependent protease
MAGGAIALLLAIVCAGGWLSGRGWQGRRLYAQSVRLLEAGQTDAGRSNLERLVTAYPLSPWADDALYALGRSQQTTGELEEAKTNYLGLIALYPRSPLADQAKQELQQLTHGAPPPSSAPPASAASEGPSAADVYEVQAGDTLGKIAKRFGTTVKDIQQANGLSGTVIRKKQQLHIPVKPAS